MGFSSISEVGNRIVSILNRELVPDVLMHSGAIGLCSPEDHGDFTIGVHLYDIGPNDDLVERGMVNLDSRRQTFPSTFLTLHYMITAYSSGDLRYRSEEDHRILGKVIQALSDNSFLGMTSALYGAPMRTRIEMERIDASEKIRLWTFPNKSYRLSLFYRVLPVEITSTKVIQTAKRVKDIDIFLGQAVPAEGISQRGDRQYEDRISRGRTLVVRCIDKETGRPVTGSNAKVSIPGAEPPVIKEDAYRVFLGLPDSKVVIRCRGPVYEDRDAELDLTGWDSSEVYEIELSPGQMYPGRQDERTGEQ